MQFEIKLDRKKVDFKNPGKLHLMVSLTAPEVEEIKRQPMDVVIVLDVSGSMDELATTNIHGPTKLDLAKEAVRKFVEQLTGADRVGIVTYSVDTEIVAPLALLDATHRTSIYEKIPEIHSQGSTDLVAGALHGLALMKDCPHEGKRTRRVLLFTDGLPTAGLTRHADVIRAIGSKLDKHTPITTFGFGAEVVAGGCVGGGYDPELLTSIASNSGGNFYHTEGSDGILQSFALELGALRSVAATDVRLKIRAGNKLTLNEVLNEFPASDEGDSRIVTIGNMYGEETQHIVVTLDVPAVEKIFPREVLAAAVDVSGFETLGGSFDQKLHAEFAYVKPEDADKEPDKDVEVQRLRLEAARKIKEAHGLAARGDFHGAVVLIIPLREAAARLGNAAGNTLAGILAEIERDLSGRESFGRSSGALRAGSTSLGTGRATSSRYTDHAYGTSAQRRTIHDMTGGGDKSGGSGGSNPKN